jgi:hypothetical protein
VNCKEIFNHRRLDYIYLVYLFNVYLSGFLITHLIIYSNLLVFINSWLNLSMALLLLVCISILFKRSSNKLLYLLLLFNAYVIKSINIPLSNTLFFIHPTLLAFVISFIIYVFWIGFFEKNKLKTSVWLLLVISLGGFWAYQEFSWGGWWNWDFVELSILNFWLVWLLYSHTLSCLRSHYWTNQLILILFITYSCFNRWGLTTSIHRFIGSVIFLQFYFSYGFVLFIFLLFKKIRLFFFFTSLLWFALLVKEFGFLKLFVFWVCIFFNKNYNFLRGLSHLIFYIIYIHFYVFNLFNVGCLSFYQDMTLVSMLFVEDFINLQCLTGCVHRLFNFNFKLLLYKITVVHFQTRLSFFLVNLFGVSSGSYF